MSRNFINEEGNFTCECGRKFSKSQSLYAHQSHCEIHLGDRYDEILHGDRVGDKRAWARGKTKDTDPSLKSMSEKLKSRESSFKGHHHSPDFKKKISEIARYNAQNHINGWKSGSSKIPNKYEVFAEQFLVSHGIKYLREVTIPQSSLGKKGSYYQLDFLVNDSIDLEIDGSSHNGSYDSERDHYVGKRYEVYRIQHNDSIEQLEIELGKFVSSICQ